MGAVTRIRIARVVVEVNGPHRRILPCNSDAARREDCPTSGPRVRFDHRSSWLRASPFPPTKARENPPMRPRLARPLILLLLLVSAVLPPPRMASCLMAAHRQGSSPVGKSQEARGRNRIGSSVHLDCCRAPRRITGGDPRPTGPGRFLARRHESSAPEGSRHSPSLPGRTSGLHLRC